MTEETMTDDNSVQAPATAVGGKDGSTKNANSNDDLGKEARMPSKVSDNYIQKEILVSILLNNSVTMISKSLKLISDCRQTITSIDERKRFFGKRFTDA